jgi:hypothetical protein
VRRPALRFSVIGLAILVPLIGIPIGFFMVFNQRGCGGRSSRGNTRGNR